MQGQVAASQAMSSVELEPVAASTVLAFALQEAICTDMLAEFGTSTIIAKDKTSREKARRKMRQCNNKDKG